MFEPEDDDFMPSSSGNLSSIFNGNVTSDSNLSYKAPKQPKVLGSGTEYKQNVDINVPTQVQSSVILTKVITLWKMDNGQNRLVGKHIVAIIGNRNQHLYEMIVYKEKTNILIRQPLNETLILYKYPKNFIGMLDGNKQFWNINFDSLENLESFLKEISTYNCQIIEQKSQDIADKQVDNINNMEHQSLKVKVPDQFINEPSYIDNTSKNRILSRITKVGQQILPKSAIERNTSTELSDSETDSTYSDPKLSKPSTVPRKLRRNPNQERALIIPNITESNILQTSCTTKGGQLFSNNNQMVLNPHSMVYTQPYSDYGVNSFIVAQNAELKANLAEINLKLSTVLSSPREYVDKNGNNKECDVLKSKIKSLNLNVENLETDLAKLNRSYENLKYKYDLKCKEIQENNESYRNLTKEIIRLKEEHGCAETLKTINKDMNIIIDKKEKLIETQRLELKDSEDRYGESLKVTDKLAKEIGELNLKLEELTLKTQVYENKLKEGESNPNEIEKKHLLSDKDILNKKIKETMNEAFRSIMEQFDENAQYKFNDIQEIVLKNLKTTTYSLFNTIE